MKNNSTRYSENYQERIKSCNTFEELFTLWKEAQHNEVNEMEYIEVKEGVRLSKDSFCVDGVIDNEKFYSKDNPAKIVFISREYNIGDSIENGVLKAKEDFFWLREEVVNDSTSQSIMQIRMQEIVDQILGTQGDLKNIAYININKRGGLGSVEETNRYWLKYFKNYKLFIRRELELLDLDENSYIVCCGCYGCITKLDYKPVPLDRIIDMHNPSRRR